MGDEIGTYPHDAVHDLSDICFRIALTDTDLNAIVSVRNLLERLLPLRRQPRSTRSVLVQVVFIR